MPDKFKDLHGRRRRRRFMVSPHCPFVCPSNFGVFYASVLYQKKVDD
jgi:hypothetical protein